MKAYKLLKDTSYAKAGTIWIFVTRFGQDYYVQQGIQNGYCYNVEFVEQTDWFEPINIKMPVGLMPIKVHRELRLKDIEDAIKRYEDVGFIPDEEWITERNHLQTYIEQL